MSERTPEMVERVARALAMRINGTTGEKVWREDSIDLACAAIEAMRYEDLVKALEQIATGATDEAYPLRAMPREAMQAIARAALLPVVAVPKEPS